LSRRPLNPNVLLVLGFAGLIGLGTALLSLPWATADGRGAPWLVALFTATSAVCVTGLAVVDTGSYWSHAGQWTVMGLVQLGGFGLMTAATLLGLAVNRQMRLGSRLLLQAENRSLCVGDVRGVALVVLTVTLSVEALTALVLTLRFALGHGMPWGEAAWQGLFHAVSAFNNAGFSTWSDGLMRFVGDAWVLLPIMTALVVGGLGFPVMHEWWSRWRQPRRGARASIHSVLTLWGTLLLLLGGAAVLLWSEWHHTLADQPLGTKLLAALFTSASARTAGFNAVDIGALSTESLVLHYALMFVGGGSAGTAGGVKITTVFVLLLIVWSEIRGLQDVEFRRRRIDAGSQRQALTVLVLSAAVVVLATLLLVPMTPFPLEKVLFEVISAFATVGLSTGITPQLPPAGQGVLIVLMFLGRVGIVTLAVALARQHGQRPFRYPEEKPLVG
jgi:trk system potassium uptake protein TrkH